MGNFGLNFRERGVSSAGRGRSKRGCRVAAVMRVASSKTSSQLWRIGGRGDSCLGTVRDSACGELLNCLVIESDRLLTTRCRSWLLVRCSPRFPYAEELVRKLWTELREESFICRCGIVSIIFARRVTQSVNA